MKLCACVWCTSFVINSGWYPCCSMKDERLAVTDRIVNLLDEHTSGKWVYSGQLFPPQLFDLDSGETVQLNIDGNIFTFSINFFDLIQLRRSIGTNKITHTQFSWPLFTENTNDDNVRTVFVDYFGVLNNICVKLKWDENSEQWLLGKSPGEDIGCTPASDTFLRRYGREENMHKWWRPVEYAFGDEMPRDSNHWPDGIGVQVRASRDPYIKVSISTDEQRQMRVFQVAEITEGNFILNTLVGDLFPIGRILGPVFLCLVGVCLLGCVIKGQLERGICLTLSS